MKPWGDRRSSGPQPGSPQDGWVHRNGMAPMAQWPELDDTIPQVVEPMRRYLTQIDTALRPGTVKTVGRATRADFIVDRAMVSRLHCRLEAGPENPAGEAALEVIDLSSTNGTFVNDERVTRKRLSSGDRLRVGSGQAVLRQLGPRLRRADGGGQADRDDGRPAQPRRRHRL